ncbi:conserved hypothetical protein, conserved [Trypanosoma brucei gambiense DAL972]|uniref:SET domain-containing protein n=1 Tax=Trypanosoma brucei gambiense (strain MHOM/CI/86/DAL972) TaxID=679716 RepID=D0A2I3_TRYB9|nr:conserved hypothetical protein, conserved [Trypanosoma brucei gambiense DAL972]CBH15477.1 conserved hypothetical protein, conserved [Trypanosoma brucei gambiense DAL972]|eukprot:XP_011777741.1 conserved hypothetical protein, conserved [Trypanosoma brucei gambiense DAL972]
MQTEALQHRMSKADLVAVFCDKGCETAMTAQLIPLARFPFKLFPVCNGPSMYRAVREIYASRHLYRCALNLCTGTAEDEELASPQVLSSLFEHFDILYGGCRYATLRQPLDVLFMMAFYAGLPLPRSTVVKADTQTDYLELRLPVKLRNANPLQSRFETVVEKKSALLRMVRQGIQSHGKLIAWEVSPVKDMGLEVLVWGAGSFAVATEPPRQQDDAFIKKWKPSIEKWAAAFSKDVLNRSGFARLRFNSSTTSEKLVLEDIDVGCSLLGLCTQLSIVASQEGLLDECVRECERAPLAPVAEVCFGGENKGYYLRASRDVPKGGLVFEDEERSFSIVTRPFVEKTWDEEKKKLFREYAWPIDADGHVYVTWDSDPNCWRPINHSCEPNCIFDENHSLNVIAARDIAKGDELTMDYCTFCDNTMKPFSCFCGSAYCREIIVPNEESLRAYGTHAWHRKVPAPHLNDL